MVNTGCYVLNPNFIARMSKGTACTIVSLVEDALTRGEGIGAFSVTQNRIDVGRISDLARAVGSHPSVAMFEYSV
jgi:NDP-sugar pyrophosphorylase family protein